MATCNSRERPTQDIISTFNEFFERLPRNRSFDMNLKVYLEDLADAEDRTMTTTGASGLTYKESTTLIPQVQPTCIAAYGHITNTASLTSLQSRQSSTSLNATSNDSYNNEQNAKKARSMMTLYDANKAVGINLDLNKLVPIKTAESVSVYENMTTKSSAKSSTNTSTATSSMVSTNSGKSSGAESCQYPFVQCSEDGWTILASFPIQNSSDVHVNVSDLF